MASYSETALIVVAGYHQPIDGQSQCIPCAAGERQPDSGAAECMKCDVGQSSVAGSASCNMCADEYFRPVAHLPAKECRSCSELRGIICHSDATTETLKLQKGHWRLAPNTSKAYMCTTKGNVTACIGGAFGDASCLEGHGGPLCQSCLESQHYFDGDSAACVACPEGGAGTAAAVFISIAAGIMLCAGLLYFLHEQESREYDRCSVPLRRAVHTIQMFASSIGLVAKLKVVLNFAQVIATLDGTYAIGLPEAWFDWTTFWRIIGDINWMGWVVPADCIVGSGLLQKLLLRALIPLGVVVAMPIIGGAVSCLQECCTSSSARKHVNRNSGADLIRSGNRSRFIRLAVIRGVLRWLPVSLVLAFCFTPSVSASIFRAWHCKSYAFDDVEEHSFLAEDPSVRCDGSDEHNEILVVAWVLVVIWPVGMVVLYASLLVPCRFMLLDETNESPLLDATTFLHRDYKPAFYWWEVRCRDSNRGCRSYAR